MGCTEIHCNKKAAGINFAVDPGRLLVYIRSFYRLVKTVQTIYS